MRELLPKLDEWLAAHDPIAIATVIQTWGSSPRGIGAKMAMTPDGKIAGSVSGGCVEGAVYEAGMEALKTGQPQYLHFGVADETAWQVGLACGGQVDVFVQPLDYGIFRQVRQELAGQAAFAIATPVAGPANLLGRAVVVTQEDLKTRSAETGPYEALREVSRHMLRVGHSGLVDVRLGSAEEYKAFIEVISPPAKLVMVGGVHISIILAQLARSLGYETIVIDPRKAFGNHERFPHVDRLIQAWPDEAFNQVEIHANTAIAVLTHDPKIDDPALMVALSSRAFYVGALGSQHTQDKRRERLLAAGVTFEQMAHLHGPIGLPLGGQTPEEIALAIMAQVVAVRHTEKNTDPAAIRA